MKNIILVIAILLFSSAVFAQATYDDNNPIANSPTGFLGWDDTGNTELDILQNNTLRHRFTSVNWNGLNGLNTNNASRILIGLNGNEQLQSTVTSPFSLLHLGYDIDNGLRRPWMNVGITLGASADFMHLGILQRPSPTSDDLQADAVVAWGCNDDNFFPEKGPDNLRFLFLTPTYAVPPVGGGPSDGHEQQGRETMRITPMGNVGIGDFSHMPSGLDEQPTQRLDVDGTARLRQMPNEEFDVVITGVYATDPEVDGDYIFNYSTIEDFTDGLNIPCDWDVIGNNVAMGYPTACATDQMLVGTDQQIGSNAKAFITKDYPGTTLRVESTTGGGNTETAGYFSAFNGNLGSLGIYAEAGKSVFNYGVRSAARQGTINFGTYAYATEASLVNFALYGYAEGSTDEYVPVNNVGVYGAARGYASNYNFGGYFYACDAERENYGVYAETCDSAGVAVYAVGTVFQTNQTITLSDESVKNNIIGVENATTLINQLQPKQYQYNTDQFTHLNLPTETSYGFIAQEVQAVLPNMVKQTTHPAKYDTTGEMISPEENLLGIKYQEFIAILTAGIKEQQAQIQSQDDQIAGLQETMMQMQEQMQMMQDQINGCCQGDITPKNSGMGQDNVPSEKSFGQNELYQNTPNPFRSQTTISYTLEQGGKVLLNIFDKTGKPIATLVEAEQAADTYRYEWDATGLPAGLYHYALYVDGELLVKKAIKLAD